MIAAIDSTSLMSLLKIDSVMIRAVMIILVLASVISWTMIFRKWFSLKTTTILANRFEKRFWSGTNLNQMYSEYSKRDATPTGMAGIFVDGYREYRRLEQHNTKPQDILEGVQRAMRVSLSRETDFLETHLSFLATVGSTSPYIGLFGTVWGIMDAIRKFSDVGVPTIGTVAPDISDALIATAMGLFAAIPAVIAYNRYSNDVERLLNRYEIFTEEFISIVQRQTLKSRA